MGLEERTPAELASIDRSLRTIKIVLVLAALVVGGYFAFSALDDAAKGEEARIDCIRGTIPADDPRCR